MSSSRRHFLIVLGAGLLTGACGFRPMLADTSTPTSDLFQGGQRSSTTVSQTMRKVYVHPPSYTSEDAARGARIFRNAMINRIGNSPQPLYSIESSLSITLSSLGITQENLATRYQANATLSYSLFSLDQTGKHMPKRLDKNSVISWAGYDVVNSPFADVVAERDAIDRVSKELAELLYLRIASYFSKRPQRQNGVITPLSAF